jgi:alkylation response protein AidB-like acyl-CoA dehydrogenase
MDFEPSDDQVALQAELRRFLSERVTPEVRRRIAGLPGAVDRALWRELGALGTFALTVPEADGGVGLGMADATIVFEELGRAAVPGPVIGTFLAAGLGLDASSSAAAGETVVGVITPDVPALVDHRDALDTLLVVGADSVALVDPPPSGRGVDRPLDPLTPVGIVDVLPAGTAVGDGELAARLRRDAALLAAALQVGLAHAAVELGADHARQRTQFDRVIGSFQAVKHLLADALVAVEVARAAVQAAGVEIDEAGDHAPRPAGQRAVDAARIVASQAADRATTACIQVHGGMGYTWELDAHLYLKRALVMDVGVGATAGAVDSLAAVL